MKKLFIQLVFLCLIIGCLSGCKSNKDMQQGLESRVVQNSLEIKFFTEKYRYSMKDFGEDYKLDFHVTIKNVSLEESITLLHSDPLCNFAIVDKDNNPIIDRTTVDEEMTVVLNPDDILSFKNDFTLEEIQLLKEGKYKIIAFIKYHDTIEHSELRLELPFEIQ